MEENKLLPPTLPQSLLPNFNTAGVKTPKRKRRGIIFGSVALVLVGFGCIAAVVYFFVFRNLQLPKISPPPLSDAEILSQALSALPGIESGAIRFEVRFASENRDPGATALAAELPGGEAKAQALSRDLERMEEISHLMQQLQGGTFPSAGGTSASAQPHYPTDLAQLGGPGDARTDPAGSPYRYESDGYDFTLTFRLETEAAVAAWNEQVNGTRTYRSDTTPLPRAAVGEDIVLGDTMETPYATFDPVEAQGGLAMLQEGMREFEQYLPKDLAVWMSVGGKFAADPAPNKTGDFSLGMGGGFSSGGTTLEAAAELRKVKEDFFGLIEKFPPNPVLDLTAIIGQWVQMTPEDLIGSGMDLDFSASEKELANVETMEQRYQLALAIAQEVKLYTIAAVQPVVEENGSRYHHYQLTIDRTKFVPFYRALAERSSTLGDKAAVPLYPKLVEALEGEDFTAIYDAIAKQSTIEVWVQAGTNLPHKLTYSWRLVPSDAAKKLAEKQFRLTVAMTLDQVNQPVTIEAPTSTISFDAATGLVTGQSPSEVTLQRQIRNVGAIREALSFYNYHANQFPDTLSALQRRPSEVPKVTPTQVPSGSLRDAVNAGLSGGDVLVDLDRSGPSGFDLIEQDKPFLSVIPNDVYTGNPFIYQHDDTGYTLTYQVKFPPKEERSKPTLLNMEFGIDYDAYVEGVNTADRKTVSREADANEDTDGDGLSDFQEHNVYGTNWLKADTDGDGFLDGVEVKNGFDPNGPGRLPNMPPAVSPGASQPVGLLEGPRVRERDSKRISDMKMIQTALELYFNDQQHYPVSDTPLLLGEQVTCLGAGGFGIGGCASPVYLGQIPKDPGGGVYLYQTVSGNSMQYNVTFTLEGESDNNVKTGENCVTESGIYFTCLH
ncbi:MAG: hypothetical protein PHI63_02390 [Patescibacteria group bacterium]|nr:hypothetical protein [Patescibacteria group bacterium]